MLDISIVNETSQEANWNGRTGRWTDGQDHVLSQAVALTKKRKKLNNMITCSPNLEQSAVCNLLYIQDRNVNIHDDLFANVSGAAGVKGKEDILSLLVA